LRKQRPAQFPQHAVIVTGDSTLKKPRLRAARLQRSDNRAELRNHTDIQAFGQLNDMVMGNLAYVASPVSVLGGSGADNNDLMNNVLAGCSTVNYVDVRSGINFIIYYSSSPQVRRPLVISGRTCGVRQWSDIIKLITDPSSTKFYFEQPAYSGQNNFTKANFYKNSDSVSFIFKKFL